MPHFGEKGIKKASTVSEEFRYYPLLRGVQEAPTPGDPVDTAMAGLGIGFGPGAEYGYDNPYGDPTINEHEFGNIAENISNAIAEAAQQVAEEEAAATPVASDDQGDPSGGSDPSDQATDSDESGDVW